MSTATSSNDVRSPVWMPGLWQQQSRGDEAGSVDELQSRVARVVGQELRVLKAELVKGVQQEIREELRSWLAEQPSNAAAGGGTGDTGCVPQLISRQPTPPGGGTGDEQRRQVKSLFVADAYAQGPSLASSSKHRQPSSLMLPGMVDPPRSLEDEVKLPPSPPHHMLLDGAPKSAFDETDGQGSLFSSGNSSSSVQAIDPGREYEIARAKASFARRRGSIRNLTMPKVQPRSSKHSNNSIEEKLKKNPAKKITAGQLWNDYREKDQVPTLADICTCVVTSDHFDYSMGLVLMANAATIGFQANYFANSPDNSIPMRFRIIDISFCLLFSMELLLRVLAYRLEFFGGNGWKWNWFDTIIVFFQIVDEIVKAFFTNSSVQDHMDKAGVIRMLRLARLLRLVRMVRLIPELKSMVYLIFASIGSFFWSLILIVIMMYCFAIYYTEIVTDMILEERVTKVDVADAKEMWGGVLESVLTLWMSITGGDDWKNFVELFKEDDAYVMHLLFFVIYIAFATLVMLNLVTGVFVEGAQRIIKEDKDNELLNMAARIFENSSKSEGLDNDHDISFEEFKRQLDSGNMDEYIKAIGIGPSEASHLYNLLDSDNSGYVSIAEFVTGCLRLRGPAKSLDMAEMEWKMHKEFKALSQRIEDVGKVLNTHISRNGQAIQHLSQHGKAEIRAICKLADMNMENFQLEESLV